MSDRIRERRFPDRRGSCWAARFAVVAVAVLTACFMQPGIAAATDVRAGQWQIDALKLDRAQQISDGSGVIVGLLDSGVYGHHPDLSGRILRGTSMVNGAEDGLGDTDGHGTAMAGDIVAKGGGDQHALGVAPGARVLSVRVSDGSGSASDGDIAQGIRWAVGHGATIINISLGGGSTSGQNLQESLSYALKHDVVVVGAAGNVADGDHDVTAPANYPGVIAVSGLSKGGRFWDGSVHGQRVALSAPADGVVSTGSRQAGNTTGYVKDEGTSDAAAFVSGAAALIRSKYPKMKAPDVVNRLIKTADDAGDPGWDQYYGFGELNIVKALTADVPHVSKNPLAAAIAKKQARKQKQAAPAPSESAEDLGWAATLGHYFWYELLGFIVVAGAIVALCVGVSRSRTSKKYARAQQPSPGGFGVPPGPGAGAPPYGQQPGGPPTGQFGGPPGPPAQPGPVTPLGGGPAPGVAVPPGQGMYPPPQGPPNGQLPPQGPLPGPPA